MKHITYISILGGFVYITCVLTSTPVYGQLQGDVREFNRIDQQENTTPPEQEEEDVDDFNVFFVNEEALAEPPALRATTTGPEEQEKINEQQERMKERDRITPSQLEDTDGDGIVDYDEVNIYGTNPNDPNTGGGPYTDGEDIRRGLDPLASSTRAIIYEDPRLQDRGDVTELYVIEEIIPEVDSTGSGQSQVRGVRMRGKAQPHAFITIYLFSRPIVVTVRADERGKWEYTFERDVEDGTHSVYIASVNNSGNILLKSEGVRFAKEAAAVRVISPLLGEPLPHESEPYGLVRSYLLWITGAIIVLTILVAILLSGISWKRKTDGEVVSAGESTDNGTETQ